MDGERTPEQWVKLAGNAYHYKLSRVSSTGYKRSVNDEPIDIGSQSINGCWFPD